MKEVLSRLLVVMIVIAMIVSMIPAYAPRAEKGVSSTGISVEKTSEKTEVVEERTENEIVYDNQDGSFTKEIYMEPIHVKEDGEWEPISNEVTKTKKVIEPERTEIQAAFLPTMEQGKYSTFGEGEKAVSFSLVSASGEEGVVDAQDATAKTEANEVRYSNVFPKTDLRNLTFNTSVKEDIVLQEYTGKNEYTFQVNTLLTAKKLADGSIAFEGKSGKVHYTLPKPVMTDSKIHPDTGNATESDKVDFDLKKINDTNYEITLVADQAWLKDKEREYPVYIDPSVQIKTVVDADISSATPTTNYSGSKLWDAALNEYVLKVGRYDDTTGFNYGYIKPDTSSLVNATIESATFNAYAVWHYSSTAKNPVKLEEVTGDWTPTGVTWNTRPATFNVGSVDIGRNQWARFDVTSSVRAWTTGLRPNKGFMMHTVNQQDHWKKFTATETGKNVPYLEVTYTYDKPEKATIKTVSNGVGTGTGAMNLTWNKMPGATGYKVIIGNGYNYEQFAVGNVTSWTTKGKGIFPTKEELDKGLYRFHTDGKGTEFASDPTQLYENTFKAGTTWTLRGQKKYIVRVLATYPGGDGPTSDITDVYMPPETLPAKPEKATIKTVSSGAGTGTGHMDISWQAVSGAIDYKVVISNGYNYEYFNTGNVTNWSTKGKKIFPTQDEIANKQYKFHQDGKGVEFANDPRALYENGYQAGSTFGLRNQKKYIVRILVVYPWGDGLTSDITDATMPIEQMVKPTLTSHQSENDEDTGYLNVSWQPVTDAVSYKVGFFNGYSYNYINVGKTTNWSTKGKKLWATSEEIANGQFQLHTDGGGSEFPMDPMKTYSAANQANPAVDYSDRLYYYARVIAVFESGETPVSEASTRTMPFSDIDNTNVVSPVLDKTSGVISMQWDAVEKAVGYKVWISDGKKLHPFDAKNNLDWSSLEQGIWPTIGDLASGKKGLYDNGNGTELAIDPSPVYQLNNPSFSAKQDYYTRITAYNDKGETIAVHTNDAISIMDSDDPAEQVSANLIEEMDQYVSVKDGYFEVDPIPTELKTEYGADTIQAMENGIEQINLDVANNKAVIDDNGVVTITENPMLRANQNKVVVRWWGISYYYSKSKANAAASAFGKVSRGAGYGTVLATYFALLPAATFLGLNASYWGSISNSVSQTNAKTNRGIILNVTWAAVYWTSPQGK
ncbi:DNRLRE domain-containing protein [Listeria booriae]|uniref:DNRLRE domain-containing protein n=1 Tax=Listeria booriae TaxID=1552123 RepID=A0A7X0XW55_9LIST|nr:DNRLRE domain-containing protein [Listeria booriae]MBC1792863.1 DNRLRE domain-containing protein [Listeria booriae]MBC1797432.1 DNRLRE domain-containing protein [Listeria booriae]MBC1812014.1 DNRLRE domain-containing protein [Listeria booriae]